MRYSGRGLLCQSCADRPVPYVYTWEPEPLDKQQVEAVVLLVQDQPDAGQLLAVLGIEREEYKNGTSPV